MQGGALPGRMLMFIRNKFEKFTSMLFVVAILLSSVQAPSARAQSQDGLKRQVNAESGRVSFIGPENGRVLSAAKALGTFFRPQDPAMALANRYAPEFGIKNPARDLSEIKRRRPEDGRVIVRYQQKYAGIPVMGGELIVNTNDNGDLYSLNGEVSPDLELPTQPQIDAEQAKQTALQTLAKYYQKTPTDLVASEPELWIFDESLLKPSTRPVELVWRMEVTAVDENMSVRELVLVNAQTGGISLHFNQIDNAWEESQPEKTNQGSNGAPEITKPNDVFATVNPIAENSPALLGATWYVATTGNDADSCTSPASPCLTINGAINKALDGDVIKVTMGIYTGSLDPVVNITKGLIISGGWDISFTSQTGYSSVDGGSTHNGIGVNTLNEVRISNFIVKNNIIGISTNGGNLAFERGALIGNRNGIYNYGNTTFTNTTISGNYEYCCLAGSAISNPSGIVKILYSTIANNTGVSGTIWSGNGDAIIEISDSILANGNSNCFANTLKSSSVSGAGVSRR